MFYLLRFPYTVLFFFHHFLKSIKWWNKMYNGESRIVEMMKRWNAIVSLPTALASVLIARSATSFLPKLRDLTAILWAPTPIVLTPSTVTIHAFGSRVGDRKHLFPISDTINGIFLNMDKTYWLSYTRILYLDTGILCVGIYNQYYTEYARQATLAAHSLTLTVSSDSGPAPPERQWVEVRRSLALKAKDRVAILKQYSTVSQCFVVGKSLEY